MLYAVKGNKQLKIDEAERQRYLNLGYDIAEVKGGKLEIVQHAPSKTVPYTQYEKLLQENEKLKAQLAAAGDTPELQAQLAEAEKKIKGLEKKLKDAAKAEKNAEEAADTGKRSSK